MKTIQLTQGQVAIVDDEDYEVLSAHRWYAARIRTKHRTSYYSYRGIRRGGGVRYLTIQMHRVVLERKLGRPFGDGVVCDHVNGDGLDNRRENLREVTKRRNSEERHDRRSSQFVGVCRQRPAGKWMARITRTDGKGPYLGIYATELEAALAREDYIEAHPELGAKSNFPCGRPS